MKQRRITKCPQGNDSLVENRIPKNNYSNKYTATICENCVEGLSCDHLSGDTNWSRAISFQGDVWREAWIMS